MGPKRFWNVCEALEVAVLVVTEADPTLVYVNWHAAGPSWCETDCLV